MANNVPISIDSIVVDGGIDTLKLGKLTPQALSECVSCCAEVIEHLGELGECVRAVKIMPKRIKHSVPFNFTDCFYIVKIVLSGPSGKEEDEKEYFVQVSPQPEHLRKGQTEREDFVRQILNKMADQVRRRHQELFEQLRNWKNRFPEDFLSK